ncbi:isochorismatase family protein [Saliterribacillus persicus]|uniref:Nicotinamidase-related amidase n=1 Tax=Saliterribacillus persicus TaxID=930114 RepID=A0A368YAM0_9BACI|nr:isochorismatase family protein [Saliterribacillus persicus]RCW77252.1 nicotinamidase-related amidase [Saliterribacillus persicus]
MAIWDEFLSENDKVIYGGAGFGEKAGLGKRPAVLIVDVNYAFCGDKREPIMESIKNWSHSCGEAAWDAIPPTQKLLKAARDQHIPVFYSTGTDSRPDGFDRGGWSHKNKRTGKPQPITEPRGNDIVAEIAPIESDIVIEKLKPSAFHGTPLIGFLIDLGIDSLIITGTTTSGCVRASVIDAFSQNFKVGVVEECTFDRGEASHAINLFDMNAKYADVMSIDETIAYIDTIEKGLFDHKIDFQSAAVSSM